MKDTKFCKFHHSTTAYVMNIFETLPQNEEKVSKFVKMRNRIMHICQKISPLKKFKHVTLNINYLH